MSPTESDRDWYVVRNDGAASKVLRAELGPIPSMDLVLQVVVFDRSGPTVIAESNVGGPGEGEVVTGVLVSRAELYVLVREEWLLGRPPTENVSDAYRLNVELLDPDEHEGEPNDVIGSASKLAVGRAVRAALGHPDDVDVFCVVGEAATSQQASLRAVIGPPESRGELELHLSLTIAGAETSPSRESDGALSIDLGRERCFAVEAVDGLAVDPFARYEVRVDVVANEGSASPSAPSSGRSAVDAATGPTSG
jgi:hypothetical protein